VARLTKTEEWGSFLTLPDALTLWTPAVFAIGGVMYVTMARSNPRAVRLCSPVTHPAGEPCTGLASGGSASAVRPSEVLAAPGRSMQSDVVHQRLGVTEPDSSAMALTTSSHVRSGARPPSTRRSIHATRVSLFGWLHCWPSGMECENVFGTFSDDRSGRLGSRVAS
jgi:hypothetical protein